MDVPSVAGKVVGPLFKAAVWLWHRYHPDTSVVALRAAVEELAWRIEVGEARHLSGLGVAAAGEAVDVSFRVLPEAHAAGGRTTGTVAGIGGYYRRLSQRRLVVVGEPGAGKTVAVSLLLLDLLDLRRQHPDELLPVRFNASTWNPGTASFSAWLTGRLAADYGVSRPVAAKLVESGRVLPVVDALDEMDIPDHQPDRARRGLDQLNTTAWRGKPVVLACRADTYDRVRAAANDAGLHLATTVTLLPLAPPMVGAYLNTRRRSAGMPAQAWEPVARLLRRKPAGALAQALDTPWMLTLAAGHLQRGGEQAVARLTDMLDPDAIREYLISEIVATAVAEQPLTVHATRRYRAPQVHTWLHHLARHLDDLGTAGKDSTAVGLDRIGDMARARSRVLFAITLAAVTGMAGAAVGALTMGVAYAVEFDSALAVTKAGSSAIGFGAGAAIINGIRAWRVDSVRAKRSIWHAHSHGAPRRWRRSLLVAGGATIAVVATLTLTYQLLVRLTTLTGIDPHVHWWSPPLVLAAYGIAVAAVYGSSRHGLPPLDERRTLTDDARSGIVAGILLGAAVGLVVVSNTSATGLPAQWPLIRGAAIAIPFGFVAGLTWSHASVRYLCAQALFASQNMFCRHPAAFLEWAHQAGLLRVTAASYQFRHHTLQHWLATHPHNDANESQLRG